ncbi:hypothetical protein DSECCO2_628650 [anaerobic digester metagenome]
MDFFLPQTQPGVRENALSVPRMRDMTISVDGGMQTASGQDMGIAGMIPTTAQIPPPRMQIARQTTSAQIKITGTTVMAHQPYTIT